MPLSLPLCCRTPRALTLFLVNFCGAPPRKKKKKKSTCRCIYDLFTFLALSVGSHSSGGVLMCVFFWPDGCSGFRRRVIMLRRASAARKNKTHRMTNTHVIHSQSMERGWLQWNYSADPARARFIRGLPHPQKIIVRTFDPPSFEGVTWVMLLAGFRPLTSCTSALKGAFLLSDVQGTAMKDV